MKVKERIKGWFTKEGKKPCEQKTFLSENDGEVNSPLPDEVQKYEATLAGLMKSIPFVDETQPVKLLGTIANGKVLSRSEKHLVYDAPNSGIQSHFMIAPTSMRSLQSSYEEAYRTQHYIKFTAHAERAWSNIVIQEFKKYITRCDDAGCLFVALTGKDIENLFHALDVAKDFIWGKSDYHEVCDYLTRIKELFYDTETVVMMDMDDIISDVALDTLIKELSKIIYVLGMEHILAKYETLEFHDGDRLGRMEDNKRPKP